MRQSRRGTAGNSGNKPNSTKNVLGPSCELPSTSYNGACPKPKTKIDKMINEIENTTITPSKIVSLFIEVAQRAEFCYDFELIKWLDIYVKLVGDNPNFTEVAILVSNAGYIYGRKVDYLWQTTNNNATKSSTVELSGNDTPIVQQPVEKRRNNRQTLTIHDHLYEAEMITKKFKSIPLAKTTELISSLHSLEPPRYYFKKWKEYKDWRKQHKKKMKNPIPYSVVCDENYIHPDMWKLSRIEDFDYDDDSETKRGFRIFTNYIEHRYSTLVPDVNFIMHFKVKDFIEAEEDEIEIMKILGLPPPPIRTWPPFCKTSHSKEYVKELYNIEVDDNSDDYIQKYIALEDMVLHEETNSPLDRNLSKMLEARNKLNDMRKEAENCKDQGANIDSDKSTEKDANPNQNLEPKQTCNALDENGSTNTMQPSELDSVTKQSANTEPPKEHLPSTQSDELEQDKNQSTTMEANTPKEQVATEQSDGLLEPSTNACAESPKEDTIASSELEQSTNQSKKPDEDTCKEQAGNSLEISINPSTNTESEIPVGTNNEASNNLETDKDLPMTQSDVLLEDDDMITVIELVDDIEMLDKSRIDMRKSKSDNQTNIGEAVFCSDMEIEEQEDLHPGNIEKNARTSVDEGIATCFGDLDAVDRDMLNPVVELVDILKPLSGEMTSSNLSIELDTQIDNMFGLDQHNQVDNIFGIDPAYLNFEQNFALPLDVICKSYPLEKNILSLPEPMLRRKKIFALPIEFNPIKQDRYKRKSDGNPAESRIRVFKLNGQNFSNITISPSSSPIREKDFLGFAEDSIDFDIFSSPDILSSTINHIVPDTNVPEGTLGIGKTNRSISNDSGIAFGTFDTNDETMATKSQEDNQILSIDDEKKIVNEDKLKKITNSTMIEDSVSFSCTQETDNSLVSQANEISDTTANTTINTSVTTDNSINNTVQSEIECSSPIAISKDTSTCPLNTEQNINITRDKETDIDIGAASNNIEISQLNNTSKNLICGEAEELDRLTKKMLDKNSDSTMTGINNITDEEISAKKSANELIEQNMTETNQMIERVQKWHRHLKPCLLQSSERHYFDMYALGTDIIDTFPKNETLPVENISLNDVMQNKDPSFISRYFLSILQLANTNNIELSAAGEKDETKPVDIKNIHLKLLNRQRHTVAIEDNIGMSAPPRKRPVNLPTILEEDISPTKKLKKQHDINVNLYANTTAVKETPIFMKKHDEEAGKIIKKYREANREILSKEVNAHRNDYIRVLSKKHDINLELYLSPEEIERVTSSEQESSFFEKECPIFIQSIRNSAIEKSNMAPAADDIDSGVFSQANNDSLIIE